MSNKNRYLAKIAEFLDENPGAVSVEEIYALFTVAPSTVGRYLKAYLDQRPEDIPRIVGFYPSADTVISLAEKELGQVCGRNLFAINEHCKATIDAVTKPKHQQFLEEYLGAHLEGDGKTLRIAKDDLLDFLYERYIDFVHESDNGIVSIAGGMNEKILIRGLQNAGLVLGQDFRKTGKNSDGDLQVEYRGSTTKILYCEVKSYAARERLLRGIRDIPHPEKIAVGFFLNAEEFNPSRTQTLLQAGPMAIYMPDTTYASLPVASAKQTTLKQDKLYRPLSKFIDDMIFFKKNGSLPAFR